MNKEEIKNVFSEFSLFRELNDIELYKIRHFHFVIGKSKAMFSYKETRLKMYILYLMVKLKFTKVM